ncbi:MAG: phosphate ABC transporter substrate-binding protein PstS [Acidobacteria bacterium]|nr:MAG: phosphate ABC transporter substrate-binding protein PstS [Acidobacteriota bacterium]
MKIRLRGTIAALVVTLALVGLFAACSQQESGSGSASGAITLNAAGATFPYPIYSKWFSEYQKIHPNIAINYQSIGSGGGIRQLHAGTVDFGASDMPLKDDMLKQLNLQIVQFPTVLGAVVPSYNIPGVEVPLKFTAASLAGIYLGKITKWNAPEIRKNNPGVELPAKDITVVHRSDGSGTTFVWTDYLSKVSPEWKSKVGSNTSVQWPVGLGGKGNEGVAGVVKQTPYSIGYVELIYALQNKMSYGLVQNSSGNFVKASLETAKEAAADAAGEMQNDVRVSITDPPGKDAYPICSFTYLLIPVHIADAAKRDAIKDFLHWMLTDGQGMVESLDYGQLPDLVKQINTEHISQIS